MIVKVAWPVVAFVVTEIGEVADGNEEVSAPPLTEIRLVVLNEESTSVSLTLTTLDTDEEAVLAPITKVVVVLVRAFATPLETVALSPATMSTKSCDTFGFDTTELAVLPIA